MMLIAQVIARLQSQCPVLKMVGGASSLERAMAGLPAFPAAFVMPIKETADESPFMDQLTQQRVLTQFVVVLAVRNLADDEGVAAAGTLWEVRERVRDALLGWTPDAAESNIEFVGGELSAFENGFLWWEESYRTIQTYRSA